MTPDGQPTLESTFRTRPSRLISTSLGRHRPHRLQAGDTSTEHQFHAGSLQRGAVHGVFFKNQFLFAALCFVCGGAPLLYPVYLCETSD